MRYSLLAVLLLAAVAIGQDNPSSFPAQLVDPVLEKCTTSVKQEIMLPALDAGKLVELPVELGNRVEAGERLGKVDDTEAIMAFLVAQAKLEQAKENEGPGTEIQVNYAKRAAETAEVDYKISKEAARRNALTQMEVMRAELEWERAKAQIKVRELEGRLAGFDVKSATAEIDAAQKAVKRRVLTAPFAGIVVDVFQREGEWVQAGDAVLHLMNFETVKVRGRVDASVYRRSDVTGKPVTVEIVLAHGERAQFSGKITYASPITDPLQQLFVVEAEVENRQVGEHWLMPHGAFATMTIHVN